VYVAQINRRGRKAVSMVVFAAELVGEWAQLARDGNATSTLSQPVQSPATSLGRHSDPAAPANGIKRTKRERKSAAHPQVWQAALHVFLSAAGIHGDHLPSSRNGIVFASRLVRHVGSP
jgi:hypothetical protein